MHCPRLGWKGMLVLSAKSVHCTLMLDTSQDLPSAGTTVQVKLDASHPVNEAQPMVLPSAQLKSALPGTVSCQPHAAREAVRKDKPVKAWNTAAPATAATALPKAMLIADWRLRKVQMLTHSCVA